MGPLDVLLKSLGDYLGSSGIQKGAITRSEDCFVCILSDFQKKTLIVQMNCNDFPILWRQLGATLGSLGGYLGQLFARFGVTLHI